MQQNMTISAAAMSIPWILWAGEYWWQRLSWASAILLGGATAIGVLAGYPHCIHGAIVYIGASTLANLFVKQARIELLNNIPLILKTGLLAVVVAIGLSAIQLLPLLELAEYSHRSAGTAAFFFNMPVSIYLRGLLYALKFHELDPPNFSQVIGSLLICLLFTLSIFSKLTTRVKGHAIASLLLLNLGMGGASPLTQVIYDHHLIPGMHFFRHMMPYFLTANIGVSLIAANSIDSLVRALKAMETLTFADVVQFAQQNTIKLTLFTLIWVVAFRIAGFDFPISLKHLVIIMTALLGAVALLKMRRASIIPLWIFLSLITEIATTKLYEFHFGSVKLLEKPLSVTTIEADPQNKDYKFYSASLAFLYSMGSPQQTGIDQKAKTMLAQLCGLSNLGWRIPSMMGALALPLRERALLDPVLEEEIKTKSNTPAGFRLIDLLSVKYIAADAPLNNAAFDKKFQDPATGAWLIENSAAKPRFQTYTNYVFVNSSEEALHILRTANAPTLTLELPPYADRKLVAATPPPAPASAEQAQIRFTLTKDEPTHYRLDINAKNPGWLFLADANYPGWRAYIDGQETPIYTAQILGKAIYIPAGDHDLKIAFKSMSFQLGQGITLATLLAIATAAFIIAIRSWRQKLLQPN